jgi:hypothetical protein
MHADLEVLRRLSTCTCQKQERAGNYGLGWAAHDVWNTWNLSWFQAEDFTSSRIHGQKHVYDIATRTESPIKLEYEDSML